MTKNAEEMEQEAEDAKEAEIEKKREKKEFFHKQQEKMNNQFKSVSDQRKAT